jgi:integrase
VLKEHRTRQAAEQLTAGPAWRGQANGYVFTTALGEPVYPDAVSRLMLVLIKRYNARQSRLKAGRPIPVARLHDLRHVHATTLLRAGVPVHVVAARLGHADPSITLRVYAHVISEQLAEAAVIFARAVGSV